MKISQHFSLNEFTNSPTALARGISNVPTADHLANITHVVRTILEPVRLHFDKPVTINSGYRSPALNVAVGGSTTSQHCNGEAVDFEIPGIPNKTVAEWVTANLPFDQCILEFYNPDEGANSGWVHVSLKRSGTQRGQRLIAHKNGRKTTYTSVTKF